MKKKIFKEKGLLELRISRMDYRSGKKQDVHIEI